LARQVGSQPEAGYLGMGDRLRLARESQGLSLRGLARRLGVSPSLISQVETGRAKPSVDTLYAIASELSISLDELLFPDTRPSFAEPRRAHAVEVLPRLPPDPVQRSIGRSTIRLASGVVWERLTTASISSADFLHVTYEVGGASSPEHEFQRHTGVEFGYVVSGVLGVTIAFDDYVLDAGDSIAFDSTVPHRLYNLGDEPVHGIWFVLGRRSTDPDAGLAHALMR
jgi:transcriptional regulator with XRE-family HTH domain